MTDLRTAAQQALECLKGVARGKYDGNAAGVCAALEAALTQQDEPVGAVLVNRESREGVMFYSVDMIPDPATLKDRFELVKLYTAPPQRPAEPVQEPVGEVVAIDFSEESGPEAIVTLHQDVELGTMLYTAPPQRKSLTSDKDRPDQGATYVEGYGYVDTRAVRAVERAHGIGEGA